MFSQFNREILLSELTKLKEKDYNSTNVKTVKNYSNIFLSEGELPERFTLIIKKFNDKFLFKQSKHIIDLNKGDHLLDKFISEDPTERFSGILINLFGRLKGEEFKNYRTKSGNLMINCLTDVEYYCPLCNLIQTMKIITNQNLEFLNQNHKYYEIIELFYKLSDVIQQTFYRIENIVIVGIIINEQTKNEEIKIISVSNEFFNELVKNILEKLQEENKSIIDIDFIKVKILGEQIDRFKYKIQEVKEISFNNDVQIFCKHEGIYDTFQSYLNEWNYDKVKSILHKNTLKNVNEIENKFNSLLDSTTELIVELIQEELKILS